MLSSATPLAGNGCSFSTVYRPAGSSPCLLPLASSSSLQPLMAGAYVYKHSGNNELSVFPEQRQICPSADSYPGVSECDLTGGTDCRLDVLSQFTVPITDWGITGSYLSVIAQCYQVSERKTIVPLYPALSASLDQRAASQRTGQGHKQSLSYHKGGQLCYHHHNNMKSLRPGEVLPCGKPYGSVSYTGRRASELQP